MAPMMKSLKLMPNVSFAFCCAATAYTINVAVDVAWKLYNGYMSWKLNKRFNQTIPHQRPAIKGLMMIVCEDEEGNIVAIRAPHTPSPPRTP
ncbi:hypothetical protein ACHQM5_022782 [Ranunculus cassubicifolius]